MGTTSKTKSTTKTARTVQPPTTPSAIATTPTAVTSTPISHEAIAIRAHELFVQSGHQHGHHEDHWLRAEAELRAELPNTPRS